MRAQISEGLFTQAKADTLRIELRAKMQQLADDVQRRRRVQNGESGVRREDEQHSPPLPPSPPERSPLLSLRGGAHPPLGFRVHFIEADGDCAFNAIRHQLEGLGFDLLPSVYEMRVAVDRWICTTGRHLVDAGKVPYNGEILMPGYWAGWFADLVTPALANEYGLSIVVLQDRAVDMSHYGARFLKEAYVIYDGVHYDSIAPEDAEWFQVRVLDDNDAPGHSIPVRVDPRDNILALKKKYSALKDVAVARLRLTFGRRGLEDGSQVSECGLQHGSLVSLQVVQEASPEPTPRAPSQPPALPAPGRAYTHVGDADSDSESSNDEDDEEDVPTTESEFDFDDSHEPVFLQRIRGATLTPLGSGVSKTPDSFLPPMEIPIPPLPERVSSRTTKGRSSRYANGATEEDVQKYTKAVISQRENDDDASEDDDESVENEALGLEDVGSGDDEFITNAERVKMNKKQKGARDVQRSWYAPFSHDGATRTAELQALGRLEDEEKKQQLTMIEDERSRKPEGFDIHKPCIPPPRQYRRAPVPDVGHDSHRRLYQSRKEREDLRQEKLDAAVHDLLQRFKESGTFDEHSPEYPEDSSSAEPPNTKIPVERDKDGVERTVVACALSSIDPDKFTRDALRNAVLVVSQACVLGMTHANMLVAYAMQNKLLRKRPTGTFFLQCMWLFLKREGGKEYPTSHWPDMQAMLRGDNPREEAAGLEIVLSYLSRKMNTCAEVMVITTFENRLRNWARRQMLLRYPKMPYKQRKEMAKSVVTWCITRVAPVPLPDVPVGEIDELRHYYRHKKATEDQVKQWALVWIPEPEAGMSGAWGAARMQRESTRKALQKMITSRSRRALVDIPEAVLRTVWRWLQKYRHLYDSRDGRTFPLRKGQISYQWGNFLPWLFELQQAVERDAMEGSVRSIAFPKNWCSKFSLLPIPKYKMRYIDVTDETLRGIHSWWGKKTGTTVGPEFPVATEAASEAEADDDESGTSKRKRRVKGKAAPKKRSRRCQTPSGKVSKPNPKPRPKPKRKPEIPWWDFFTKLNHPVTPDTSSPPVSGSDPKKTLKRMTSNGLEVHLEYVLASKPSASSSSSSTSTTTKNKITEKTERLVREHLKPGSQIISIDPGLRNFVSYIRIVILEDGSLEVTRDRVTGKEARAIKGDIAGRERTNKRIENMNFKKLLTTMPSFKVSSLEELSQAWTRLLTLLPDIRKVYGGIEMRQIQFDNKRLQKRGLARIASLILNGREWYRQVEMIPLPRNGTHGEHRKERVVGIEAGEGERKDAEGHVPTVRKERRLLSQWLPDGSENAKKYPRDKEQPVRRLHRPKPLRKKGKQITYDEAAERRRRANQQSKHHGTTLVIFGCATSNKGFGYAPLPNKAIREELARQGATVVTQDEWRTSQECPTCRGQVVPGVRKQAEKEKKKRDTSEMEGRQPEQGGGAEEMKEEGAPSSKGELMTRRVVTGIRVCPHCEPRGGQPVYFDRDLMAALNIFRRFVENETRSPRTGSGLAQGCPVHTARRRPEDS